VDVDGELVSLVPSCRRWFSVEEDRRGTARRTVSEGQPHLLGDVPRLRCPSPKLDVACVVRLDQVGDDVLERALVPNQSLHDCRRPRVIRDAVEEQPHPVEHAEAEGVRQAAPWAEADVDAAAGEASQLPRPRCIGRLLAADEVGLQFVERDCDLLGLKVRTASEQCRNVTRPCALGQVHGPGHKCAIRPVLGVAHKVEGFQHEVRLPIRPSVRVTDGHRKWGRWRQWRRRW
jgi:hypothetical protein